MQKIIMKLHLALLCGCMALLLTTTSVHAQHKFPVHGKRVLVLGDSITHGGGYVAWIETQLRLNKVEPLPQIINVGLSSETCSGLSEPKHPFPRPDVHERLDRALVAVKPDVVVACYGMNDGIYYPLGEKRFQAFKDGVKKLVKKSHDAGAKVVLLTPPPFDAHPLRKKGKLKPAGSDEFAYSGMYENYDEVLTAYGKWMLAEENLADMVIDLHGPLTEATAQQRKTQPGFTFAPDGIHPNAAGHRLMGQTIVKAWGLKNIEPPAGLYNAVRRRTGMLHDAWLSHIGHKRPGVRKGLPIEQANKQAAELEKKISTLMPR